MQKKVFPLQTKLCVGGQSKTQLRRVCEAGSNPCYTCTWQVQESSQSLLEWVASEQDHWKWLEKCTLLESQLLEAAWLLVVLCQQDTAKLLVFAVGEQAVMLWCSFPAGLMLCPHAYTPSWLWAWPAPCQGATTHISSLPLCPGSLL